MKKELLYILMSSIFALILSGCYEEGDLTPTERPEFGYSVPQGNHDYDDIIVDWKKRYNSFFLYQFVPRDLYWTVTGWTEATQNPEGSSPAWNPGSSYEVADENYVGEQLALLEETFLQYYPDTLLNRCLPLKVLLCGELYNVLNNGNHNVIPALNGYDYIAVNWGSENITTMTNATWNTFKQEINTIFINRILGNGKLEYVKGSFWGVSDYDTNVAMGIANYYARGFLTQNKTMNTDWNNFLKILLTVPYETLITESPATNTSRTGILHPTKDVNGLIRKKYDILIDFFAGYGIDIQAIGNSQK